MSKCDHDGLSFDSKRWLIRCELCKKEWSNVEVRKALNLLDTEETQGKKLYEIQRAINWIQNDVSYIRRQLEQPTITYVEEKL